VALLFPDLYEVGMSHLGLGLLYDILNRQDDVWAERAYAPAPDLEAELRGRGLPLTSLESATPLREFDLVGISLQYELSYTNLLNMLDLGGIPLLAADRGPNDPVVIGGGPGCCNPEPVASFFDALVLGDGEEVILELAAAVQAWKAARGARKELWQALEEIEGVYIPAFFEPVWDENGRLREIIPRGRRNAVRKRILSDLNSIEISPRPLVPYCQIVHDRVQLEIARGCSRGCRYCQAGMLYRPVRERDPAKVLHWVEKALDATGYEDVSLLSLSAGDYGPLPWLLAQLMDRLAPRKVALSLPSLRADSLTSEMMAQIKRVRRTGLTLAPEAGSGRLRRLINKNLTEETIIASASRAFNAGWQLLKLYFMIGLPGETPEDLEAIAGLTRQILKNVPKGRRGRVNLSLSTFIPKAHTPFQWEGMASLEESRGRLHAVKDRLRHPQIQAKWNSAAQSWLEGLFSRGDRRLAAVILAAHRRGCRLDAWSEHLRLEPWREAFREAGVNPEFYLREREMNETLPWDHLIPGSAGDSWPPKGTGPTRGWKPRIAARQGARTVASATRRPWLWISTAPQAKPRPWHARLWPPAPSRSGTASLSAKWTRPVGSATWSWSPRFTAACGALSSLYPSATASIPCPGSLSMGLCPWAWRAWPKPWTWPWLRPWMPPCWWRPLIRPSLPG
jgi:radical SAM family uncharacterized protein